MNIGSHLEASLAYRQTDNVRAHLESVRAGLLIAGLALVAEEGFAGVKVARVAERAGVATGTVYRHFSNKGALCAEIFSEASQIEVDRLTADLSRPGRVSERLSHGITAWCRRAHKGRVLATALLEEPVDAEVDRARLHYRSAYARLFEALILEGQNSGELPEQNPAVAASCIVGALSEAVLGPSPSDNPETTNAIVAFVLNAVGANP